MIPPILAEKIDKLHFSGLYLTLFLVSSFLFVDCFALTFWGNTVAEILEKPVFYKNIVLLIFYLIGLYLIVPLKFLIIILTPVRWYKIEETKKRLEHEKEYYTSQQLLNDAVKEDNKVKLQIFERAEANSRQIENIKTMTFTTMLLVIWNCCLSPSVLRIAFKHQAFVLIFLTVLFFGIFGFISFWKGDDSITMPLIKRINDDSYHNDAPKGK